MMLLWKLLMMRRLHRGRKIEKAFIFASKRTRMGILL